MKVLQINSVCGIGSTGRIATDIHAILKEQGHKSYIAFGRENPINCDSALRIGNKYDNYKHVTITRIFDRHGFGSKRVTRDFITVLKTLNPDVIHLHNIHGYYLNIELFFEYLKESNKPVIWTLHDCWSFTGHCTYFDDIGCNKWMSLCHSCPQKKSYPSSMLLDNSKQNFKIKKEIFTDVKNLKIVTVSKWLRSVVEKSFLNEYPIKVIENGIDLNIFKPVYSDFKTKYNIENQYVLLGVASEWEERKGLRYFLKLSENLEDNYKIVLVGLNKEQINTLPKNIIGLPKTNNIQELIGIYSSADIYLNLSVEETMGLTTVEALACGTPVIVFNATALPEIVDQNCGLVVDKGDISMLKEAIFTLKSEAITKNSCINRAKLYEKNKKYNQYINLYTESLL
ncbi:Glycosyltransferase involved in cell wall bisynthesis [Bacillus sp. OV322]|uniref:glycosyltransferase n=1 Tax=Bacillus sp. OV322 TaxID=1882764 RepID=UPI0008E0F793|nr:glycosyltransferase [Bacillus sp. OV322]SFC52532.1 Glycosyltransferase involved in cell wall bisynthesis [Bacillus sp. OV322]